ncbi:MAG TPA: alpha/beta hydrolase, partial [Mycobacterium sp.]|nr:alpha/beta hydrolase [Mycobacterium sp.]
MPVVDGDVDPILLKVLDVVPFRLSLADGAEAGRA